MGSSSSHHDLVGQIIQDMKVERLLHESAQGVIFLVRQVGIGRTAVLKLLPKDQRDPKHTQSFLTEAATLSQFNHANIATLYDVGMFEGRPYLVTEYIPGEALSSILQREGPFAPDRALGVIQQVIHALEEAHSHDILHRNLSLKNVMIESLAGSNQDLVKLLNFGPSRWRNPQDMDDLEDPSRVLTMTPEEGLGAAYTPRSEIYVCGVMLYQLMTGQSPYQSQNTEDLWDEIVSGTPVPLDESMPALASYPELQPLIDLFLSKKASLRPTDARNARLHIGQCLSRVKARGISLGQQPSSSFPVINTVEHVPALPRETFKTPEPYQKIQPIKQTWLSSEDIQRPPDSDEEEGPVTAPDMDHVALSVDEAWDQIPVPSQRQPDHRVPAPPFPSIEKSLPVEARSAPTGSGDEDGSPSVVRLSIDFSSLRWAADDDTALARLAENASLLLAVSSIATQLPSTLLQHINPVLRTRPPAKLFFLVCEIPSELKIWMKLLHLHAQKNHLRVGLSLVRRLDQTHLPPHNTLRMSLRAAERSEEGHVIASRHAVNALQVLPLFKDLNQDATGRYSSFLRFAPSD